MTGDPSIGAREPKQGFRGRKTKGSSGNATQAGSRPSLKEAGAGNGKDDQRVARLLASR
jgi:hypothetical protein